MLAKIKQVKQNRKANKEEKRRKQAEQAKLDLDIKHKLLIEKTGHLCEICNQTTLDFYPITQEIRSNWDQAVQANPKIRSVFRIFQDSQVPVTPSNIETFRLWDTDFCCRDCLVKYSGLNTYCPKCLMAVLCTNCLFHHPGEKAISPVAQSNRSSIRRKSRHKHKHKHKHLSRNTQV